jgi:hypothetical protein
MQVTDVRAVIAIGLRGRLPWEGNRGREYVADVERFFELTRGPPLLASVRLAADHPVAREQAPVSRQERKWRQRPLVS